MTLFKKMHSEFRERSLEKERRNKARAARVPKAAFDELVERRVADLDRKVGEDLAAMAPPTMLPRVSSNPLYRAAAGGHGRCSQVSGRICDGQLMKNAP